MKNSNEKRNIHVFFDGYYFQKIYNNYLDENKMLNTEKFICDFIKYEVSDKLEIPMKRCEINGIHFYIGGVAQTNGHRLESALLNLGVNIHRLRLSPDAREKGVDVRLALDAYKCAANKKFDVMVLVSGDADFVPLIDEIKELGISPFLVCWDEEKTHTRTSQDLIDSVSPNVLMINEILDSRVNKNPFKDLLLTRVNSAASPVVNNGAAPVAQDLRSLLVETIKECEEKENGWVLGADIGLILRKVKKYEFQETGKKLNELFQDYPDIFETKTNPFAVRLRLNDQPDSGNFTAGTAAPRLNRQSNFIFNPFAQVPMSAPRLLTKQELDMEYESHIITMIEPGRDYGFIKSEQEYSDRRWNNYNFAATEVRNRRKEELVEGMKVKFSLLYDPFRSNRDNVPLYKAVNITVVD